jgi:hypothetical protein
VTSWRLLVAALVATAGLVLADAAWANEPIPECGALSASFSSLQQCGTPAPGLLGSNGWYVEPIQFAWNLNQTTRVSGCDPQNYYGDTREQVSCTFTWSNGNETINATVYYNVEVELSNPVGIANLGRPPDSNGWYNHPITGSFGVQSISGLASCNPAEFTYSGPSAANVTLSGSCTDNAGKTATASVSFNYDATPPTITTVTASRRPDYGGSYTHPVSYTFHGTDGLSGIARCQTVTYSGPVSGWLTGGCWDNAGNYASRTIWVHYLPMVSTQTARASIAAAPLLLRWGWVRRASYYNVQIYRDGRKLLSRWPAGTTLLLPRSWTFDRHRYRLKPGRYRWYVWPGLGSRRADRYGRMVVSRTFTVS